MYCPGCGTEITPEQQFCRQCGFRLERVIELFSDHWSSGEALPDRWSNVAALLQKQKKIDRSLAMAAGGLAASALLALLIGVIYQVILVKGDVIPGLIVVWLILGTALIGGLASYRRYLRKTLSAGQVEQTAMPTPQIEQLLSKPLMQPMTSVTEPTTGLLPVQRQIVARSTGEGFLKS